MATQLQALVVACVLAMTPMMMTPKVVTATQGNAPQWALIRIADYSTCRDPQLCRDNFKDVLTVYCIAFSAWTPVAGAVCAVSAIF